MPTILFVLCSIASFLIAYAGCGSDSTNPVSSPPPLEKCNRRPVWSPDGSRITFESTRDGDVEIYVMDADGSNPENLTNNGAGFDGEHSWSPDGTKIVYSSFRDGNFGIYLMDADGAGATSLTSHLDAGPSWSPDGSRILFTRFIPNNDATGIYVMDADGTNQVQLTSSPLQGDEDPTWSPDGTKIAFSSLRESGRGSEIYVMEANGSGVANLTQTERSDWGAAWSPDGSRIAFVSQEEDSDPYVTDIFLTNADGTDQVNLTNDSFRAEFQPAWSPDGTKIIYLLGVLGNSRIYVMNADGPIKPNWQVRYRATAIRTPFGLQTGQKSPSCQTVRATKRYM